jgi:EEF1A lysine methyltransferase 4
MCEDMYDEGYWNIQNIDISSVCVESMKQRNYKRDMKWDVMDVRNMNFNDASFDLIIDKSTIDNLFCTNLPKLNVSLMLAECSRVLRVGGSYVAISCGAPDRRE